MPDPVSVAVVPVWAFGGPRRLDAGEIALAGAAARLLLDQGVGLVCGCATGADAAAIQVAACQAAERLRVLCAFGPVPAPPDGHPRPPCTEGP